MIYTWECRGCGIRVDVSRKVVDHEVPPQKKERACMHANHPGFRRIITAPKLVKVQQFEDTETGRWPI